ncbi:MAG: hypothetical protein M9904_02530 [Chitinophagaceae bacterium]|nr:hypothetical protein [Chitinophagaceae bacterium]
MNIIRRSTRGAHISTSPSSKQVVNFSAVKNESYRNKCTVPTNNGNEDLPF